MNDFILNFNVLEIFNLFVFQLFSVCKQKRTKIKLKMNKKLHCEFVLEIYNFGQYVHNIHIQQ